MANNSNITLVDKILGYSLIVLAIIPIMMGSYLLGLVEMVESDESIMLIIMSLFLIGIGFQLIISFFKDVDFKISMISSKENQA